MITNFIAALSFVATAPTLGVSTSMLHDEERQRDITYDVWFRANDDARGATNIEAVVVFEQLRAVRDAAPSSTNQGIVLLSHGSGGTEKDLAWLVPAFVDAGFIVVAARHPGNTYGDVDARSSLMIWERPRDISRVLDAILIDPTFAPVVDESRVIAVGHSLGGYTVLALAGARYDYMQGRAHCASPQRDPSCDFVPQLDPNNIDYSTSSHSFRDPRIKTVVALAPAVGPAFIPVSAEEMHAKILIVAARDDELTTMSAHALSWAETVNADFLVVPSGGHAVFVGPCNQFGQLLGRLFVRACTEPRGAARKDTQDRLTKLITAYATAP